MSFWILIEGMAGKKSLNSFPSICLPTQNHHDLLAAFLSIRERGAGTFSPSKWKTTGRGVDLNTKMASEKDLSSLLPSSSLLHSLSKFIAVINNKLWKDKCGTPQIWHHVTSSLVLNMNYSSDRTYLLKYLLFFKPCLLKVSSVLCLSLSVEINGLESKEYNEFLFFTDSALRFCG